MCIVIIHIKYMWAYSRVYIYESLVWECEHAGFSFREKVTEFQSLSPVSSLLVKINRLKPVNATLPSYIVQYTSLTQLSYETTETYAVGDTEDISSTDFLLRTPRFCLSLITGSSVSNELLMSCQLLMQIEEETDIEEMTDIQLECGLSDLSTLLKM